MKTKETLELELFLFNYLQKMGTYCVFECQIGKFKGGRVDCISIDTDSIVKCYELKVTKNDFHSKHGHNFIGHYNYYVMPLSLYKDVYNEVQSDIGIIVADEDYLYSAKKSKRKECSYSIEQIKDFMLRSLYRKFQVSFPLQQRFLLDKYDSI